MFIIIDIQNTTAMAEAFYIIKLPILLLNKLITKLLQIERQSGIKHDELTWIDIMNKHSHTQTHPHLKLTGSFHMKLYHPEYLTLSY